jgi:hypothetical protein
VSCVAIYSTIKRAAQFRKRYVNDEDIRHVNGPDTPVKDGDHDFDCAFDCGWVNRAGQPHERFAADAFERGSRPLLASLDHAGSWYDRSAQTEGRERTDDRHWWFGRAAGNVSAAAGWVGSGWSISTWSMLRIFSGKSSTAPKTSGAEDRVSRDRIEDINPHVEIETTKQD